MTDKELKKLSRKELLEMLVLQTRKTEALERKVKELQSRLDDRTIAIEKAGDLAQAALMLNGVFEAAQKAADQYLENIRMKESVAETENAMPLSDGKDGE